MQKPAIRLSENLVYSTYSHHVSVTSILILLSNLLLGVSLYFFPELSLNSVVVLAYMHFTCFDPLSFFYYITFIWWNKIMKLPLCDFLQSCVTLLSLNFKFFYQQCVASLNDCMYLTEIDRTLFVSIIVIQNILAFLGAAIRTLRFRSAYPVCYCPSGTYYKSHGFFRNSRSRII